MNKQRWFLGILIIGLLILIAFEPRFGWWIRGFLGGNFISDAGRVSEALVENEILKSEIYRLENLGEQLKGDPSYKVALVSSRYPFNFKNEILIDAGEDKNVKINQVIVFLGDFNFSSRGLLIGKVEKVFSKGALVRTIFDKGWQSSVRIGKKGYLALLRGGGEPEAGLIPKDAKVKVGDIVYSVEEGLPNSLPIGEVLEVRLSADQAFQEVKLGFPYSFSDIKAVAILDANE